MAASESREASVKLGRFVPGVLIRFCAGGEGPVGRAVNSTALKTWSPKPTGLVPEDLNASLATIPVRQ